MGTSGCQSNAIDELVSDWACGGANERCVPHFESVVSSIDFQVSMEVKAVARTPDLVSHGRNMSGIGARVDVNVVNTLLTGIIHQASCGQQQPSCADLAGPGARKLTNIRGTAPQRLRAQGRKNGTSLGWEQIMSLGLGFLCEPMWARLPGAPGRENMHIHSETSERLNFPPKKDVRLRRKLRNE
jgi:hypothetical protein